ncbi:CynX/NimT family MFS transporter [Nocardiopsis sp. FIRDI 009]|uniref:MFS transporter n=1 Tax=Nocardiopsis sp. FIRDI 009 TaxID=714197 RepID=UPI000E23ED0A|nr:MFS transporter [Nocardiopsis sp. FIRDI 009]
MSVSSVAAVTDRPSVRPLTAAPTGALRGRILSLLAITCAALNLRLVVTALSPLLTTVGDEFGFAATVIGVFGTLPLIAFAVFGLVTPAIMRRLGPELTAVLSMLLTALGQALRAFAPDTGTLLVLTAVALAGAALGNVVLPPLIKQYFPDRLATLSTVQMVAIHTGALFPPLVAVPLAEAVGWRPAIGVWAVIALAAAGLWVLQWLRPARGETARAVPAPPRTALARPVWRVAMAWRMALLFGMVTWNVFTLFTWLPTLLADAGHTNAFAGSMVSLMVGVSLLFGLVAPTVTVRSANTFPIVALGVAGYAIGYLGVAVAPEHLTPLWAVFLGMGTSLFVVTMTMINTRSTTPGGAGALSGFVQGVGSGVALGGPLLFGLVGELTGGWGASYLFVAGGSLAVALVVAYIERTPRTIEAAAESAGRSTDGGSSVRA